MNHEKILYLYSRALENADFETISQIMLQAASDPDLKARLFDLEAAYQAELPAPDPASYPPTLSGSEVPMLNPTLSSNGYRPALRQRIARPRRLGVRRVAAALAVIVLAAVLVARHALDQTPGGISTTRIAPHFGGFASTPTPIPLAGHPTITAQNALQLAEVRRFGSGVVRDISWSPDSQTLLYAGAGLWFYDATTYTETRRLDTGTLVEKALFSPDGSRIATANQDGTLRLYDVASGAEQVIIPFSPNWIDQIAFSPDGSLIAASDSEAAVRVWDTVTGRERLALRDMIGTVYDLKFSPDGTMLAAAGNAYVFDNGTTYQGPQVKDAVQVWSIPGGEDLLTLYGPAARIAEISFHPNSRELIAASWDGLIHHWSLERSTPVGAYEIRLDDEKYYDKALSAQGGGQVGMVPSAAYSPDGTWIASMHTADMQIRFWQDGKVKAQFFPTPDGDSSWGTPASLTFSPDGQRLLVSLGVGTPVVWDISDPLAARWIARLGSDHEPAFTAVALSPDGSRLAAAASYNGVRLWNANTGTAVEWLDYRSGPPVNDLAFSPDGQWLALAQDPEATYYGTSPFEANYPLLLWNTDPAVEPLFLTVPGGRPMTALAFNADGTRLFAGGQQGWVQAWDVASHTKVSEISINPDQSFLSLWAYRLASNPAGSVVAFLDFERSVRLWDVVNNVELPALTGHSESVQAVAFSPDGTHLAATDQGGTLIVWDTATWTEVWYQREAGGSAALAYSPDGSLLAVAGYTEGVTFWDTATRQKIFTLTQQPGGIPDLAFSADGTLLVTAGGDGTVRLWAVP